MNPADVEAVAKAIRNATNPLDGDPVGVMIHNYEFLPDNTSLAEQSEKVDEVCRAIAEAAIAALRAQAPAPATGEPVAYRYVHHDYAGRKVSRYGTHPERVNGHDPIEVHPLYAAPPTQAAMPGDVVALVEQLEAWGDNDKAYGFTARGEDMHAAAALIQSLQREVEALKKDHQSYCKSWDMRQLLTAAQRVKEEAVELLAIIMGHFDAHARRNAPGHSHDVSGIWDRDVSNGERGGTACEWCGQWSRAQEFLTKHGASS